MEGFCGCRGARRCRLCEGEATERLVEEEEEARVSLYSCHNCGALGSAAECSADPAHPPLHICSTPCSAREILRPSLHNSSSCPLKFEGVTVVKEFIRREEEAAILSAIDSRPWIFSQSGRRKQDYGPKVNFKRQKLKLGLFNGLPHYMKPFVKRMRDKVNILNDFIPVELCNLDYHPDRGAHIVGHRDNSWLWGERLVTLNLLSPVLLTFSHPPQTPTSHPSQDTLSPHPHIHMPLPSRSLVIVQGPARHHWLHAIERQHVISRRVGITLRELTDEFLPGGHSQDIGGHLLEIAQTFNGEPTNS